MYANQVIAAKQVIDYLNTVLDKPNLRCTYNAKGVTITLDHTEDGQSYVAQTLLDGTENSTLVLFRCVQLVKQFMHLYSNTQVLKSLYASL
jgi:hypothetical protein